MSVFTGVNWSACVSKDALMASCSIRSSALAFGLRVEDFSLGVNVIEASGRAWVFDFCMDAVGLDVAFAAFPTSSFESPLTSLGFFCGAELLG